MNNDDLNAFINRYATQYTTQTAVLLTGEWGSGKSYYINNVMKPYLKENKVKCVVVSLYGVDNLEELSRQIYLNLRFPPSNKKSEKKQILSIVGRNIINNALSLKGLNINASDHELKKLYESVNLNNVLLVIEDVERSSIDISKLLGFINGLVEYDGAKVLLVANENELLKIDNNPVLSLEFINSTRNTDDNKEPETEYESIIKYKKIKEKTIGDTIQFKADIEESVKSIICGFSGIWVKTLLEPKEIAKISNIVLTTCKRNLRLLKFALQKCNDIFVDLVDAQEFEESFYRATFEGMLIISKKFVSSDIPEWEGTQYISARLGSSSSPVFRFVYDYLRWNSVNIDEINAASNEYKNYRYFEEKATSSNDEDLSILSNYHINTAEKVFAALTNLEKKLCQLDFIGVYAYEKLGYLAIKAGEVVDYNTDKICSTMIKNAAIMCKNQNMSSQEVLWDIYGSDSDSETVKKKYRSFMSGLSESIEGRKDYIDFSYMPKDIHEFYEAACKNKQRYIIQHKFISRFDISKLTTMLGKSSAEQINDFRGILFVFYRDVARNEYDEDDRKALSQLLESIEKKRKGKNNWDKIQLLQIDYLKSNISDFISKME